MDVFDKFADQFSRIPMFFMTFHGQESIDKVINVSEKYFDFYFKTKKTFHVRLWEMQLQFII